MTEYEKLMLESANINNTLLCAQLVNTAAIGGDGLILKESADFVKTINEHIDKVNSFLDVVMTKDESKELFDTRARCKISIDLKDETIKRVSGELKRQRKENKCLLLAMLFLISAFGFWLVW